MSIKDYIKDLNTYVASSGFFEKIKITAGKKEILVEAMDKDKEVIFKGKFNDPLAELQGEFGLSNLNLLNTIANDQQYTHEDSVITIETESRDGETVPATLGYRNASHSEIYYRFMGKALVPNQPKFQEPKWDIVITPTKANIQQFAWAANGLSAYEQYFQPAVKDKTLRFFIGEDGAQTQRGGVVFATDVDATFNCDHKWKISDVQSILKYADTTECEMAFSTKGAIQITLKTGLAEWKYILTAKVK
jgi:hypothetical protein